MRKPFSWVTKHPVQAKYLIIVMLSIAIPTLFLAGCLYFLMFSLMAEQFGIPEGVYSMLMPVFYKINIVLLIGLPAVFLTFFWIGLAISHRFAGPIERLEGELDKVLSGDWARTVSVRQSDDLAGVVQRINRILAFKKS